VTTRVAGWIALVVFVAATAAGCAENALRQAEAADQLRDYDLAVAEYTKELRLHPGNREAVLGLDRAKLRASDAHLLQGRRLYGQGRYEEAQVELQLASELNPTNAEADTALREVRNALRAQLNRPESGETALESLLDRTRDLGPAGYDLPSAPLQAAITTGPQSMSRFVYMTLGKLANVSVTFDQQFRDVPAPVSLAAGMTIKQALDAVAAGTGTFYQVTAPNTIIVIPDTPAKRREYTDEVVRQFTVQNADLKETMDALRVVADARYVAPVTGTNAILVRDTPDRMRVIGKFLSAFDKARPEVVVDVEVLEVDRNTLQEYGAQIASPGQVGIDGVADPNGTNGISLEALRNLTQANVLMTNIPALYYRLLKSDTRTRTLANPHLRITDGTAATASFGQEVPIPTLTVTPIAAGGANIQPQTAFSYKTIGVNIGITPRTHPNDDVTLALNIELSSLGPAGFDGIPTFGQRNVTTSIRLKDGETNILAGLIREDELTTREDIPGLGKVPILGSLFALNHKEAQQTDVVIMLTPHIVRVLDLAEDDLRPLRLPREGTGNGFAEIVPTPAFTVPTPTPPAPAPRPDTPAEAPTAPPFGR
jgi:general secretion pathway protein D